MKRTRAIQLGRIDSFMNAQVMKAVNKTWERAHINFKADLEWYAKDYNEYNKGDSRFVETGYSIWLKFCKNCWRIYGYSFDLATLTIYNFAQFSHYDGNSADVVGVGPPPKNERPLPDINSQCFYTAHYIVSGLGIT